MIDSNSHKERPNWLLYILIFISLGIHAGFVFQTPVEFDTKPSAPVAVSVYQVVTPHSRPAPRPRPRPHQQGLPKSLLEKSFDHVSDAMPADMSVNAPIEDFDVHALAPESPSLPTDIPEVYPMEPVDFVPPAMETAGPFGSPMAYLDGVRQKIENFKQYPPLSRQRNIEGVVTVAFVIELDGSVSDVRVAKSSGFPSLDAAAMRAVNNALPFVRPPKKYFEKKVRVKVPIVFELLQ